MKKISISILFSLTLMLGFSQESNESSGETRAERNAEFNKRPFKDRLAYGGEFTFYVGGSSYLSGTVTNFSLCPFVGYRINPDLTVAIGPNYQYWAFRGNSTVLRDHFYGGRIFVRHELGRNFFLHGEYEVYNMETYSLIGGLGRSNIDLASLGAGYKSNFGGEFGYYYVMVLFDFIQNYNSAYIYQTAPLIFKAGIIFGK
jgi:hypothetical protein